MKYALHVFTIALFILSGCTAEEAATTDTAAVEPLPSDTAAADAIPPTDTSSQSATTAGAAADAPYDAQFIDTMSAHHRMGRQMNQMQIDRGSDARLKAILRKSNDDMEKDLQEMKSWRDQWHPNVPVVENHRLPGGESMNMDMAHLQSMSGADLDQMVADMMITHHEGALSMSRDALQRAQRPELKEKAQQIIDGQTKEIEELRAWKTKTAKG